MRPPESQPKRRVEPEHVPANDELRNDLISNDNSGDDVSEGLDWTTIKDLYDIPDNPEVPEVPGEDKDYDPEDDDTDDSDIDYNKDIKPFHRIPVGDQPHAPSPVHPDDIPFDPDAQRDWEDKRKNPDDPDSVPRGYIEL